MIQITKISPTVNNAMNGEATTMVTTVNRVAIGFVTIAMMVVVVVPSVIFGVVPNVVPHVAVAERSSVMIVSKHVLGAKLPVVIHV